MDQRDIDRVRIKTRLIHVLGWHCRVEDLQLSDLEFVIAIFKRYAKYRDQPLVDPAE